MQGNLKDAKVYWRGVRKTHEHTQKVKGAKESLARHTHEDKGIEVERRQKKRDIVQRRKGTEYFMGKDGERIQ